MGTLLQHSVKNVELFYTHTCYVSLWWCSGAPGGGPLPCVCLHQPAQRGAAAVVRCAGLGLHETPACTLLPPEYFTGEHRDDYQASDVQDYFMYMGMLASEARQRAAVGCCAHAQQQGTLGGQELVRCIVQTAAAAVQGSPPCPDAWRLSIYEIYETETFCNAPAGCRARTTAARPCLQVSGGGLHIDNASCVQPASCLQSKFACMEPGGQLGSTPAQPAHSAATLLPPRAQAASTPATCCCSWPAPRATTAR